MDNPLEDTWRKHDAYIGEDVYATIYKYLVGSLMYFVNIRANIFFVVNKIYQFMVDPTNPH